MKVISKEVNANLKNELRAYLRHQRICQLALWSQSIDALKPTDKEKAEYEKIRAYIEEENAKASAEGYKISWTLPVDNEVYETFVRKYELTR